MGKRRRKSNNSKSGLTPPSKTGSKMATTNQNNISQVLTQAHESLHGSYIEIPASNPINMNNNQTFTYTCSPNRQQQPLQNHLRPILQSTPLPGPSHGFHQQPAPITFIQPSLPSMSADIPMSVPNVTPQMIFSNINDTNNRLQRLEQIMNEKLSKLDLLDVVAEKFERFERVITGMRSEIEEIKHTQEKHSQIIHNEEKHHHNIEDRVRALERDNRTLENENHELKEKFLELQTHSMKYNLIFTGIKSIDGFNENTEEVLRLFLEQEMGMTDASEIKFQNVHRLSERNDGKERSIIARFFNYSDHERVRKAAADKLKNKPFSVYQQYPREINERRKQLIPKMKELKRQKRHVKLIYDKLFVDGEEYRFPTRREPPPTLRSDNQQGQGQN